MSTDDDLLHRLATADPVGDATVDTGFDAAVRARVHAELAIDDPAHGGVRAGRRRRRPVLLVAAVGAVMLATVSVGSAVLNSGDATSLTCVSATGGGQPDVAVVNPLSGDPLADCASHLAAADRDHYQVFSDGAGTVVVAPDLDTAHAAVSTKLELAPDLTLDAGAIELRMALDDVVTGANGCGDVPAVVQRAEQIVAKYAPADVPVVQRDPSAGPESCAFAFVDGARVTVVTEPPREPSTDPTYRELLESARSIHTQVDEGCLTADEARDVVDEAIAGTDQDGRTTITSNDDPAAACARVHTNAYGSFEVTIYAPPPDDNGT